MGLDRDSPAKDLTLVTSGLSREGVQTTDEISMTQPPPTRERRQHPDEWTSATD